MTDEYYPTEQDREMAEKVAKIVGKHLLDAGVSLGEIHEVATQLATDLGQQIANRKSVMVEQLYAAAVDDHLCPPDDGGQIVGDG